MKLAFSCCGFGGEKLDARVSQDEIGHLYDKNFGQNIRHLGNINSVQSQK